MDARPTWSHSASFPAHDLSPSEARRFVREHLGRHGLPNLVDDVALVVSELATNARVHAQTAFTVTLQAFGQSVLLQVHDGSKLLPHQVNARPTDTNGRGLAIVESVSREWGVAADTDGRKSVWARFTGTK